MKAQQFTSRGWRFAGAWCLAGAILASCGGNLPPITIEIPPPAPTPPAAPAPIARATLAFVITDVRTNAPIDGAQVSIPALGVGWASNADGYAPKELPQGTHTVVLTAVGYVRQELDIVLSGNLQLRAPLEPIAAPPAPPAPTPVPPTPAPEPPAPTPAPVPEPTIFVRCGTGDNTMRISPGCLEDVAAQSEYYRTCNRTGDQHACHYYVREVARALVAAQQDARWGLITKPPGRTNVDGYGEDVLAYLPPPFTIDTKTWQWRGADIVGGAGAPGARWQAGELPPAVSCKQRPEGTVTWCNEEDNYWARVPEAGRR